MRLKKGDVIIMLSGRDKGKKGKVLNVLPERGALVVEGINIVKRHQRPTRTFQGGIIEKPLRFAASKAMLVCPRCSKPTRVKIQLIQAKRVRSCGRCQELIDKV